MTPPYWPGGSTPWQPWYRLAADGRTPVPCESDELPPRVSVHVGDTRRGDTRVSTVFLGLDHAFGEGPPVLWETMVFGGPLDGAQERYTSYDDAVNGHAEMCRHAFPGPEPGAAATDEALPARAISLKGEIP